MPGDRLSSARLEAFSDGVIAVIITIMVLELHVPAREISNLEGLRHVLPLLLIYALSFIQTGIYWVNHHYLVDDVETVSHGLLWANLAFLFTLSLIPFATAWVGERGISAFSISLYSVCCALPAVSWIVLSNVICNRTGAPPVSGNLKQFASAALYLGAIPAGYYVSPLLSIGMVALVAVLWLIPPKQIVELTRVQKPSAS